MPQSCDTDLRVGRRATDITPCELILETRRMVEELEAHIELQFSDLRTSQKAYSAASEKRHQDLANRIDHMSNSTLSAITENNRALSDLQKMFKQAFPEGNIENHRRAHEAWIEKDRLENEFWMGVKKQAVSAALIAVMGFAVTAVWLLFLQGPKI